MVWDEQKGRGKQRPYEGARIISARLVPPALVQMQKVRGP